MTPMRFLRPEIGWWLLAALAGVGFLQWYLRRSFAASTTVRWLGARSYRASMLRRVPLGMSVAGLVLCGLALMEPVLPYSQAEVQSRGLDIVMVLDLSSSMQEEMASAGPTRTPQNLAAASPAAAPPVRPFGKTRLEATKDAIKAFVRGRRDDRIALVVFSDHAYVVSPLTFDYDYLLRYIDMVDDRILQGEGRTAMGDGLALANFLLARQSKGSARGHQVGVLFSDGENNRGRDPIDVLAESNDANIRVHFIGVDLEDAIRSKPDVQRFLQNIRRYGGRSFDASTAGDLVAASSTIDSMEKGFLVNKVSVRDAPVYQWFAVPALLCLAAAVAFGAIPYFVDQT